MINYDDLYQSLDNMVEWTFQRQAEFYDDESNWMSVKARLKELSTIKFALPRQSGHSTFAMELFRNKLNNSALLFHNIEFLLYMEKKFKITKKEKEYISTFDRYPQHFIGRDGPHNPINNLIVDCASFLSKNRTEDLYDFITRWFCDKPFGCIVFLG